MSLIQRRLVTDDNQTDRMYMKHSLQELTELEQAVSQEDYEKQPK
jgi:hypothetical protein